MERGFFEKEGLKPRYIQFQGTNLMLNALMSNELDYVTILPFIAGAATRGLPVKIVAATAKSSGYAIISRPDIDSVKALKGKRLAINTFGSSADFAIYQLLSRNGLDPNKDVTLLSIAGSPDARFAALLGGSVDATVVNSPFEYRAEQKGFKTLLSVKETAEFVKIPIVGLSTSQRKIDKEPDEIVRMLRALRNAILFLQNQREIGAGLVEKLLSSTVRSPSAFTRSIANSIIPISPSRTRWLKNGSPWELFGPKKKSRRNPKPWSIGASPKGRKSSLPVRQFRFALFSSKLLHALDDLALLINQCLCKFESLRRWTAPCPTFARRLRQIVRIFERAQPVR